jgi:hypothetical protein
LRLLPPYIWVLNMNSGPVLVFSPPTESQVEKGEVRAQLPLLPGSGNTSTAEIGLSESSYPFTAGSQDEVKVHMEPPGEIAVYQFVNQQGTLILQVPPQPLLNLANQISQELAQEAAPKESVELEGGQGNGS